MSVRELKALGVQVGKSSEESKRTTRSAQTTMEDRVTQLERELAEAKTSNEQKELELTAMKKSIDEKDRELASIRTERDREREAATTQIAELEAGSESRLNEATVRFELDKLRELERLRAEHVTELRHERQQLREEKLRADNWISDLKAHFGVEKDGLLDRIRILEEKLTESRSTAPETHARSTEDSGSHTPEGSGTATSSPAGGSTVAATTTTTTTTTSGESVSHTTSCGITSPPSTTSSGSITTTASGTSTLTTASVTTTPISSVAVSTAKTSDLQALLGEFLEAQKKVMVQAAATQGLPPLARFTGDDSREEENNFSRWHDSFEERARLAGWTTEQKLWQLKAHLSKTALQVFQLMPESERTKYETAVAALKKRFQRVDIQELRGLEFCRKLQGDESVEQLGMDLLRMARRAFPTVREDEFNRLLKGRFFQALHVKWQRKIGAPKPDESFQDLYDRARLLEQYEKQYSDSVAVRNQPQPSKINKPQPKSQPPAASKDKVHPATPTPTAGPSASPSGVPRRKFACNRWHQIGHLARHCTVHLEPAKPKETPATKPTEAPGRGSNQRSHVGVVAANHVADELTVEELEGLLSRKRLMQEQDNLKDSLNTVGAITVSATDIGTVGPALVLDVSIEGLKVESMVDCGSPTTIISRTLLHSVAKSMVSQGREPPQLSLPTLKLYGKDGKRELTITAQTTLTIEADGKSARIPVFVQPDSEQACLLGMNAAPALGLSFCRANGEPLTSKLTKSVSAHVCLVQSTVVPGRTGKFLEARLDVDIPPGTHAVFEPVPGALENYGLSAPESLLTVSSGCKVLVPIQNFQQSPVELKEGTKLGLIESVSQSPAVVPRSEASVHCSPIRLEESKQAELLASLSIPESSLTVEQHDRIKETLAEFSDVFALSKSELGCCDLVQHGIDTSGHSPIKLQPYRIPVIQREKVARMIQEMEDQGVVKASTSPWSSPIVLVPKRDGSLRFCVDYRRLNSITKKDVYPLPRIEDILVTLGKAKYFSTLDLASGYWQIKLDPASAQKTAFTSHCGLHEFTRMPFGLCNAPATFQRLMQTVLAGLEWESCFVYIDDILVASTTFDEHLVHLRQVLERLRRANLRLKPSKCSFLRDEVLYLGYVISKDGMKPDPARTSQVENFPTPKDVTQVRQFIGLASYYRRFIPAFAKVASPLHALTKKNATFTWTDECETAFSHLKRLLVTAPVLAFPQFGPDKSFILETDASLCGLGAVLSQEQSDGLLHPIAYASRSLHQHEQNYAISELETLGLVWSVKHFRVYLLGHHCTVYTDHAACVSLLNTPKPSAKLARWAMTVQEFDLTIKHRSGKKNQRADALSRNPATSGVEPHVNHVIAEPCDAVNSENCSPDDKQHFEEIRRSQREDPDLGPMILFLEDGKLPENPNTAKRMVLEKSCFDLIDGVLYYEGPSVPGKWRIAVPKVMQKTLLSEAHDGKFAGHFGELKIYNLLRKTYWWNGMRADVRRYCRSCLVCATRKGTGRASRPPLQPIPVGGPFQRIGVDVLQLPRTLDGNRYVVVFLDYLTKWAEAFAVSDQTAETIARLLIENIVCRHGVPEELLSDRGPNFLSELVREVCKLLGVKKINTSGYHPQCDGLVEKFNSKLINMIAKSAESRAHDWDRHLPYLLFSYRVSVQDSTKESPFFLLYGRDPRVPTETALSQPRTAYMVDLDDYKTEFVCNLSDAWKIAQENIKVAQTRQKSQYDKKSKESTYKVGDRVMTYMPSEVQGKSWKLARPFHGPYRIISLTPTNAEIRLVDKPSDPSIFVSLSRLRPCYTELQDVSYSGRARRRKKATNSSNSRNKLPESTSNNVSPDPNRPVTRSMTRNKS